MPSPSKTRAALATLSLVALIAASPVVQAGAYDDLMAAAANNQTETVLELLGKGLDVNTTDRDGTTLAMIAARTNNHQLLDFLLRNRASLLKRNKYGDDAVMLSAYNGDLEAVQKLVKAGAWINHDGWTPLHYAAFQGHAPVVAYLLENGAEIDAKAANQQTALMMAALNGHSDVALLLKQKGADLGIKSPQGKTAQDLALESHNTDLAKALVPPPEAQKPEPAPAATEPAKEAAQEQGAGEIKIQVQ